MENLKADLIEKINTKIKENKIKMKPRIFFMFRGFLVMSFVLILLLASVYIGNFILLIFHEHNEVLDMPHVNPFHFHEFLEFLKIIPGLLILLLIIFIVSLYKLIKDHAFVYRKNILYIIGVLFLILIATVINIHIFLDNDFKKIRSGERGGLPPINFLHKYYRGNKMLPSPPFSVTNHK